MASPRWSDFGSIWKTIREVDVLAIRREAEHDLTVACAGDREALEYVRGLLLDGPDRYPSPFTALGLVPLDLVQARERLISEADLLLVALRPDVSLSPAEVAGLERLESLSPRRRLLVLVGEPAAPVQELAEAAGRGQDARHPARSRGLPGPARRRGARSPAAAAATGGRAPPAGPAAPVRAAPDGGGVALQRGLRPRLRRAVARADPGRAHHRRRHRGAHQEPGADGLPARARVRCAARVPAAHDGDHSGDRRRRRLASGRRRAGRPRARLRDPAQDRGRVRGDVHHGAGGGAVVRHRPGVEGRHAADLRRGDGQGQVDGRRAGAACPRGAGRRRPGAPGDDPRARERPAADSPARPAGPPGRLSGRPSRRRRRSRTPHRRRPRRTRQLAGAAGVSRA